MVGIDVEAVKRLAVIGLLAEVERLRVLAEGLGFRLLLVPAKVRGPRDGETGRVLKSERTRKGWTAARRKAHGAMMRARWKAKKASKA